MRRRRAGAVSRFDGEPQPHAPEAAVHPVGGSPGATGPSLRARALALLAMREYSGLELRRKLGPHAESQEQLDALIAELAARGILSDERFAESLIRRRAQRYGLRRIELELDRHAIAGDLLAPLIRELAGGERERALAVWRKRFGHPPADALERGRQQRFLAQRGFSGETIAWVFRQARDAADPD